MKILVAEADAQAHGGAEAYADGIRRALACKGCQVGQIDIRGHRAPDGTFQRLPFLPGRSLWNWAQVCRSLPFVSRSYDAVVFAYGEGPDLRCPTLTIRHAPALFSDHPDLIAHLGAKAGIVRRLYAKGCRRLAGLGGSGSESAASSDLLIANSRWTAKTVARQTDTLCDGVLYPPLSPPTLSKTTARQPFGIVALGRLVPNKRHEEALALVDALRDRGLPATLTIVGRGSGRYADDLAVQIERRPHVTLLRNATDAERATALASATLGFHGYRGEHFGIAVAEMILSGILPVVHNSGGVRELVIEAALRYQDLQDAVVRADRVLCRPDLARRYLAQLQQGGALAQALDFDRHAGSLIDRWLGSLLTEQSHAAA